MHNVHPTRFMKSLPCFLSEMVLSYLQDRYIGRRKKVEEKEKVQREKKEKKTKQKDLIRKGAARTFDPSFYGRRNKSKRYYLLIKAAEGEGGAGGGGGPNLDSIQRFSFSISSIRLKHRLLILHSHPAIPWSHFSPNRN